MSTSSSFGKFIGGALLGGVIGAIIGMLLAPRSGAETRRLIREEFDQRCQESADMLHEQTEHIQNKAHHFRERISEVAEELEQKGQQVLSRFQDSGPSA